MAEILKLTASNRDFIRSLTEASGALGKFTADANIKLAKWMQESDKVTTQFNKGLGRVSNALKAFSLQTLVGITLPLGAAAKFGSDAYAEYDALKRSLGTLEPSLKAVNDRIAEMEKLAKLPGLGFQEAIQADVRLRTVGLSVRDSTRALREFSNAVARTGGGKAQFGEITYQLSQMIGKSKVLTQDLRPIIEAAPAVANALQNMFGTVSADAISDQLQAKGKNSKQFVSDLLDELEKAPRVTGGWRNALENLSDTLFRVSAKTMELADHHFNLSGQVNSLENAMNGLFAVFTALPEPTQKLLFGLTATAAILPVLSFGASKLIDTYITFTRTLYTTRGALGLVGIGLGILSGIMLAHYGETKRLEEATKSVAEVRKDAAKSVDVEATKLNALVTSIKDAKVGSEQYKNIKSQILQIAPQFSKYLKDNKIDFNNLSIAAKNYAANLINVSEAQMLADKIASNKRDIDTYTKDPNAALTTLDKFNSVITGIRTQLTQGNLKNVNDIFLSTVFRGTVAAANIAIGKVKELDTSVKDYTEELDKLSAKITAPDANTNLGNKGTPKIGLTPEEEEKLKKQMDDHDFAVSQWWKRISAARKVEQDNLKKHNEVVKDFNKQRLDFIDDQIKKEAERTQKALDDHLDNIKKAAEKRKEIEEQQIKDLETTRLEQEEMLNNAIGQVISGGLAQMFDGESNGFNRALKSQLQALGDYAMQLGLKALPIIKLQQALFQDPTKAKAFALIAGGIGLKALAGTIQVGRYAKGAVTQNPIMAILGDNPSGKEMALPFERNAEFANDIAKHMGGRLGGGSGDIKVHYVRVKGSMLELAMSRIND